MRRSSSSGNFSRKLQPAKRALRRLASKFRSKLSELDFRGAIRVIRNRTNRIITYCSNHLFRHNRSLKPTTARTPSYRRHNHHNYISDYYSSNRNLLHHNFSAIYIDQLYADDDHASTSSHPAADRDHRSGSKTSTSSTAPPAVETRERTSERGKEVAASINDHNKNKRPPLPVPVPKRSNYSCREGGVVEKTVPSLVQRRTKKEHALIVEEKENNSNNPMETLEDAWREVVARSPQLRPVDVRAEEFIHNFRADMKIQKDKSIVEYRKLLAGGS
ncbi:hypothetical protein LINGRAHAP2_LOCUS23234 [Linum grandiflorum]